MDRQISIVLADDHPIVRAGLRSCIERAENMKVIGEAGDGETALTLVKELRPDVAVLDIHMPKLGGMAVAREIQRLLLPSRIVFLTLHDDQDLFRTAIELGILGYILKDSATMEIVACLQAVVSGRPYYTSILAVPSLQKPQVSLRVSNTSKVDRLSPTERRILQLIASGKSSKEIGAELSMNYRTVQNHRTNMCRKLALEGEGPSALLRYALQNREA